MQAKLLVSSIALIGGMALAMPVMAQTQSQQNPGMQPAPMNSQMNGGQNQAQGTNPMPAGQDQSQSANRMPAMTGSDQSQARMQHRNMGMSQDQAQNEQPMMKHKMRHHMRKARMRHEQRYGEGNGPGTMGARYGTDVARGGGVYTRQDVASEAPGRMSHPGVGSPRAPSQVAKGSLAHVNQVENADTARLNQQQLRGNGETASLPNNE
jgi:hypothetical protein